MSERRVARQKSIVRRNMGSCGERTRCWAVRAYGLAALDRENVARLPSRLGICLCRTGSDAVSALAKAWLAGMIFGGRGDARDFILGEGEPHFVSRSFATSAAVMAEGLAPKRAVT